MEPYKPALHHIQFPSLVVYPAHPTWRPYVQKRSRQTRYFPSCGFNPFPRHLMQIDKSSGINPSPSILLPRRQTYNPAISVSFPGNSTRNENLGQASAPTQSSDKDHGQKSACPSGFAGGVGRTRYLERS